MRKTLHFFISTFFSVAVFACVLGQPAQAEPLSQPEGQILLTVTGVIQETNSGNDAVFDRAMLEELGLRDVTTTTIWTEGPQIFTGVPLKAVIDRVGGQGNSLSATAINDYSVSIPFSDVDADSALLAFDRNGSPMSVRDKGPIWLIYPYDSDTQFRSETYHSRSIWQLDSLEVLP